MASKPKLWVKRDVYRNTRVLHKVRLMRFEGKKAVYRGTLIIIIIINDNHIICHTTICLKIVFIFLNLHYNCQRVSLIVIFFVL